MYFGLAKDFEETNMRLTLQLIDRYKEKIDISEDDLKKIHELLEESKKDVSKEEESKEKNKEDN